MAAFELLHQDQWLLAVNKPAGIAVIPGRDEELAMSLRGQLESQIGENLWVVHRLDRDTSGVLLFARDAETHRQLNHAFEQRQIEKRYWALAAGAILPDRLRIDQPLHSARKGRMRPAKYKEPGALAAFTELSVLRRYPMDYDQQLAELELRPRTGRQHQLRVHLRSLDAPLFGDPLYRMPEGQRLELPDAPLKRLALHAISLDLTHPATTEKIRITAPLAADLELMRGWLAER